MSLSLTSNKLLESIKRRAMVPGSKKTFDDDSILELANEEVLTAMLPELLSVHEEYFVHSIDIPIEANKTAYEIPYRAVGNKLRGAQIVDTSGNLFDLARIKIESLPEYKQSFRHQSEVFYVKDNKLVLVNTPSSNLSLSLRMYFYIRPNEIVQEDLASVISSIDRTTGQITVTSIPEDFNNQILVDLISMKTPNKIYSFDQPLTLVDTNTNVITIDPSIIPEDLENGDVIAHAEQTIVPQLPVELHSVLAQRVIVTILESLGDTEGVQLAERKLLKMEKATSDLVNNRVESSNEKVVNKNRFQMLLGNRRLYGRR